VGTGANGNGGLRGGVGWGREGYQGRPDRPLQVRPKRRAEESWVGSVGLGRVGAPPPGWLSDGSSEPDWLSRASGSMERARAASPCPSAASSPLSAVTTSRPSTTRESRELQTLRSLADRSSETDRVSDEPAPPLVPDGDRWPPSWCWGWCWGCWGGSGGGGELSCMVAAAGAGAGAGAGATAWYWWWAGKEGHSSLARAAPPLVGAPPPEIGELPHRSKTHSGWEGSACWEEDDLVARKAEQVQEGAGGAAARGGEARDEGPGEGRLGDVCVDRAGERARDPALPATAGSWSAVASRKMEPDGGLVAGTGGTPAAPDGMGPPPPLGRGGTMGR
jgi:hypothetical protein